MSRAVLAQGAHPAGLGHAVDIEDLYAQAVADPLLHALGEGLRSEDAHLQVGQLLSHLFHHLDDANSVGDHAGQYAGLQVLGQLDLPLGIARAGWDHEQPRRPGSVVHAEATVE